MPEVTCHVPPPEWAARSRAARTMLAMTLKKTADRAAWATDPPISKPDKLLWPDVPVTKQDFADYLRALSADMLPWLHDRPLTMVRAPDGVGGKRYYQKAVSDYAPNWI